MPLPKELWVIVANYAYESLDEMQEFCATLNLPDIDKLLLSHDHNHFKNCVSQALSLLSKETETAQIMQETQREIDEYLARQTARVRLNFQTQKEAYKLTWSQELAENNKRDKARLAKISGRIAAREAQFQARLDELEQQVERRIDEEVQKVEQIACASQLVVHARAKQLNAQENLEHERRMIEASESYLYAINHMIMHLKRLTDAIDAEILKKNWWSHRVRFKTCAEIDAQFGTSSARERFCIFYTIGLLSLIGALVICCLLTLPIFTILINTGTLDAALIPMIVIVSFLVVGIILCVLAKFLIQIDRGAGIARFENYTPNYCLSSKWFSQFAQVIEKVSSFQKINSAVMESKNEHPLLTSDPNTDSISSIRDAIKDEITFFKGLRERSSSCQEQFLQAEEVTLLLPPSIQVAPSPLFT